MKERICPSCGRTFNEYPALSRKDNKTLICPACGQKEALEDCLDYLNSRKSKESE